MRKFPLQNIPLKVPVQCHENSYINYFFQTAKRYDAEISSLVHSFKDNVQCHENFDINYFFWTPDYTVFATIIE